MLSFILPSPDPMTDMFAKKKQEKKERTSKNELQRLKNIARSRKLNGKCAIINIHTLRVHYAHAAANLN